MQRAVDNGLGDVRALGRADDDVAELARSGLGAGAIDGEGEDVGGLVLSAMGAVELGNPRFVRDLDGDVALLHTGGEESGGDGVAHLRRDIVEVEAQAPGVSRGAVCASRAVWSRCASR